VTSRSTTEAFRPLVKHKGSQAMQQYLRAHARAIASHVRYKGISIFWLAVTSKTSIIRLGCILLAIGRPIDIDECAAVAGSLGIRASTLTHTAELELAYWR
jgi:hypothetical protein